jgi:chromosomal replication initiator protein
MRQTQPENPHALLGDVNPEPSEPAATDVAADSATSTTAGADAASDQDYALPAGAHAEVWKKIQAAVRERVQPEQFETWFRRAALHRVQEETVCIAVQNSFSRDWLQTYYQATIEDAVSASLGSPRRVEFHVDPELTMQRPSVDAAIERASTPGGTLHTEELPADHPDRLQRAHSSPAFSRRTPSDTDRKDPPTSEERGRLLQDFAKGGLVRGSTIGLNPKYTFENYVMGPCNRFAHAAALGAAESPGSAYNPLFLHGSVGLGKTHLLQSLCFALLENFKDVRILYLSCETFVNHFISALENGDLQKFRNKYRGVDVLVVDDIHLLANKERTQEEFFHTFNTLYNAGKQIVLSSDSTPKDIPTLQERLVSRFKWGLVTEMEPPCYETRMAILKRKSRERGREVPDDVASLLAERIDTNIRELEGAVTKLIGYARLSNQAISVELAREALPELFTVRRGQPSMEEIIDLVTGHYGVKLSDLQSKKRTNAVAYPRQVAMYLARKITRHSLAEIGGFFGGRDHSTVLHAVDKIDKLVGKDPQCRDVVHGFLDELQAAR